MGNLLLKYDEMFEALSKRDSEYDGVFFSGVRTTGVFCRVTCTTHKPQPENLALFESTAEAIQAGFRPCKHCHPMEVGNRMPDWMQPVIQICETEPGRRWNDEEIRRLGVDPRRIRDWFLAHHGITFHHFLRGRRLAGALRLMVTGRAQSQVALDAGYESECGFRSEFQQWFDCIPRPAQQLKPLQLNCIVSPLGPLVVVGDAHHIYLLEFADRKKLETQFKTLNRTLKRPLVPGSNRLMDVLQHQLEEYFTGTRHRFDIPFATVGTDFQKSVWSRLCHIDYGSTASYEQIAKAVGRPRAQRAVGQANGDNRLAILIPCHRIIRQSGELSGYGGGIRRKQWMLNHERANLTAGTFD